MGDEAHGQEDDEQVDPDGEVGEPAEFLQRANLTEEEAGQGPDETADGVAQLELRRFGQRLAVGNDDDGHAAQQLDRLQDVETVAGRGTVEAERQIPV